MPDTEFVNQIDTGFGSESHSGLEKSLMVSLVEVGAFMGCSKEAEELANKINKMKQDMRCIEAYP